MSNKTAIVIGAGIGGLAAAIRIAKKGYRVTVYEKSSEIGGKTKRIELHGFKWGYGASLLTMPHLIDELFELCHKNPNDYYHYISLNTICKYFFTDGTVVNAFANQQKLVEEFQCKLAENPANINAYLKYIKSILEKSEHIFLQSSLHKLKTYFNFKTFKSIIGFPFTSLLASMNSKNHRFFTNAKTVQLFNRYATYNGSNPYRTPATMSVIAAPEYTQGAYIMEDGMPQIAHKLTLLAKEIGVEFKLNSSVTEIICENKKAIGIQVNNEFVPSDIVVSNVDIHFTYHQLLPNVAPPTKILNQERSTSALIFYWGISKKFEQLDTHNIFFSDDYKNEFDAIEIGKIYDDATIYLFISSKMIPAHAPVNSENWFVLINVPHHQNQDWNQEIKKSKALIIKKISMFLKEDISQFIVCEYINTPQKIEADTCSFAGSLYGPSSNNKMSAFLRHPNFSKEIKNLYFTGGSVHPGGGVPLCLLSGKIVASLIDE